MQLGHATFVGAIDAWIALGASEDATARAAARALDSLVWRVVHAASRSKSLAAGAVVAAVARGAASAPVLQLANTGVARALAPAVAVEAPSSTFGLEAASPTPEVVMADASASTSGGAALEDVAPAPAADCSESDDEETLEVMRARVQLRQDESSSDDDSDDEDQDSFQAIAPDADGEDVEEALQNAESEELAVSASDLAALERYLAAEVADQETFHAGLKAACAVNTAVNTVWFTRSQRGLGHPDGYTLRAIFDTDNPSLINAIPREEFLARVNAKKQELDLPVSAITPKPNKSEVAARRVERQARTPMFKHDECSIAFPRKHFDCNLYVHLSGCRPGTAGQPPIPVKTSSKFCRSKEACENCQKWVRKVAEGASLETPGAGWVPSRDQVLGVAARVRAALPHITFDGVDLHVAGPSKRGPTAPPPRSSKRARAAPKKLDV